MLKKYSVAIIMIAICTAFFIFTSSDSYNPIKCDEKISFAKSIVSYSNKKDLKITGLSNKESWGRWSDGKLVEFIFKMPQTGCKLSKITFDIHAFLDGKFADIYLNSEKIGEFKNIGASNELITIDLPKDIIKDGNINSLKIMIDNPTSPWSAGVSSDARLLAFGFRSMTFN